MSADEQIAGRLGVDDVANGSTEEVYDVEAGAKELRTRLAIRATRMMTQRVPEHQLEKSFAMISAEDFYLL